MFTRYTLLIISSRQRPFPAPREIAQAPSRSHPTPHHHLQRERRSDQACQCVLPILYFPQIMRSASALCCVGFFHSACLKFTDTCVEQRFMLSYFRAASMVQSHDAWVTHQLMSVEVVSFFGSCEFSCYALNIPASCVVDMRPLLLGISLRAALCPGGYRWGMCLASVPLPMVLQSG